MRLFINTILLVLLVSAGMATAQDVQNPGVLVHLDRSLYFPGDTLSLRCVAMQAGLPATVDYSLQIEKKVTVQAFLGGFRPGVVIPAPVQEQWVEVERHSATCRPGEMVQSGPFVSRTARTEPFARIPVSQTNEVWQSGLYRIWVKPVPQGLAPAQMLYFKVDSSAEMPNSEPRMEKVAGGLQICTASPLGGYIAIVTTRSGVGVQRVPAGNPDIFLPLLQPEALEGPVILTLYNPYESGGREGGQETVTFVVP